MDKLAEKLTRYVLVQGVIEEEDYAIYKYGFQTGIMIIVIMIIIIMYSHFLLLLPVLHQLE